MKFLIWFFISIFAHRNGNVKTEKINGKLIVSSFIVKL
jgi:hypothetical protein